MASPPNVNGGLMSSMESRVKSQCKNLTSKQMERKKEADESILVLLLTDKPCQWLC